MKKRDFGRITRLGLLVLAMALVGGSVVEGAAHYYTSGNGTGTESNTGSNFLYFNSAPTFTAGDSYYGQVSFGNANTANAGNGNAVVYTLPGGALQMSVNGTFNGTWTSATSGYLELFDNMYCGSNFSLANGTAASFPIRGHGFTMALAGPLTLTSSAILECSTSGLVLDAQGNTVTLANNGSLKVDAGVSVTLRNMNLVLSALQPIYMADHTSVLTLDNVNIVLAASSGGTYVVDNNSGNGQFYIANNVVIGGVGSNISSPAVFQYNSNYTLGITTGAQLTIGDGVTFLYEPSTPSNNALIWMAGPSSKLKFDNASFAVNSSAGEGVIIKKGMVIFDNLVHLLATDTGDSGGVPGSSTDGAIVFGTGSSTYDVDVRVLSGATVIVEGYVYYRHS